MRFKEEANEGGGGAGVRGGCGGLGGLGFHKELNFAKGEGGGDYICSTRTRFTGLEVEEESDPGKVCYCSYSRRAALGD